MEEEKQKRNWRRIIFLADHPDSGRQRILRRGIVNYLRSLKYFFTPIGALSIGIVSGFSILLSGAVRAISELSENLTEIARQSSVDLLPIRSRLIEAIGKLNWNRPTGALQTVFTTEWLTDAWQESVASCEELSDPVRKMVEEAVGRCAAQLTGYLYRFVLLAWIGMIAGYLITKWQIRRDLARRALWKALLISAGKALLGTTVVALCVRILVLLGAGAVLSLLISLLLWGFLSLSEAYLVHGWKTVNFRKTVNFKTVGWLLLTDLLIFSIAIGSAALIAKSISPIVGFFVGSGTVQIAYIVSRLNAEAFIKELAASAESEPKKSDGIP